MSKKLRLDPGQKFGHWTVIREHGRSKERYTTWECKCVCGNIRVLRGSHLKRGATKSCGCVGYEEHRLDLAGKKSGRLLAIRIVGQEKNGAYLWECKCDCGNFKIVRATRIKSGTTRSCGCLKNKGQDSYKNNFMRVLYEYRYSARRRGLKWGLSNEQALELFKGDCFYCNIGPSRARQPNKKKPVFVYNGIDRLDPSEGYTEDNCVSCCTRCNLVKSAMSYQDFVSWVEQVYYHLRARRYGR